jgi:hypothetical protein
MILPIILLAGAGLAAYALHKPAHPRREVTGASGNVWFVETLAPSHTGSTTFGVFMTEGGADMVLRYDQDSAGIRHATFQAPTPFAAAAKADFGAV